MLCGILHPSRGIIKVLGMNPQREREKVVRSIGALFGHKSQLPINLKAKDAVEIVSMYYDVEKIDFEERFWKLAKLLEIEELAERRVRTLSLGERMRFELIASLIHNPKILLLDEPTIGLDFAAKAKIRKLIRSLGKTVLFTSHDALDIEAICERVIIMDHGKILMDTSVSELRKLIPYRYAEIITELAIKKLPNGWEKIGEEVLIRVYEGKGLHA
jgi:ABC-2 type transport system ATP-binding protein